GICGQDNHWHVSDFRPFFLAKRCNESIAVVVGHADIGNDDIDRLLGLNGLKRLGNITRQNGSSSVRSQDNTQQISCVLFVLKNKHPNTFKDRWIVWHGICLPTVKCSSRLLKNPFETT